MGKGTNTTSTTTRPDSQAYGAYSDLLRRAAGVASTPYQAYSGELVAPLNAQQYTGIGGINQYAGFAQPYIQQAAGYARQAAQPITGAQIAQYESPYIQQVVNATEQQFNQQNAQQQSQLTANAAAQGALGGDRVGVAQGTLAGQQQMAEAPVIAGLYSQGYNTALQTALAEQQNQANAAYSLGNLGVSGQNAGMQGAAAQFGAGSAEQQWQQALDQALYQQFQIGQAFPYQQTQWLAGLDTGVGSQMGGTSSTTAPPPSPWGTIGGLGIAGLAMFSDERLKEGIQKVGHTNDGQPIYRYRYKGSPEWHIGLLSQEVEEKHPDAVHKVGGLGMVDYKAATDDAAEPRKGLDTGGGLDFDSEVSGKPWGGAKGYLPGLQITPGKGAPPPPQAHQDTTTSDMMKIAGLGNIFKGGNGNSIFGGHNYGDADTAAAAKAGVEGGLTFDPLTGYVYRRGGGIHHRAMMAGFGTGGMVRHFDDGGGANDLFETRYYGDYDPPFDPERRIAALGGLRREYEREPTGDRGLGVSDIVSTTSPGFRNSPGIGVSGGTSPGAPSEDGVGLSDYMRDNKPRAIQLLGKYPNDPEVSGTFDRLFGAGEADRIKKVYGIAGAASAAAPDRRFSDPEDLYRRENDRRVVASYGLRRPGEPEPTGNAGLGLGDIIGRSGVRLTAPGVAAASIDDTGYVNPSVVNGQPQNLTGPIIPPGGTRAPDLPPPIDVVSRPYGDEAQPAAPVAGLGAAPAATPAPENTGSSWGGWNPFGLSDRARTALLAAGLGMMASRSPFAANAIGEGGLRGLATYSSIGKEEEAKKKTEAEVQKLDLAAKQAQKKIELETKQLELRGQQLEQGKYSFQPGMGIDPATGQQVAGSWRFNAKTGDRDFQPGVIQTPKTAAAGAAQPSFDQVTLTQMADQYLAGDRSVLVNLGRGAQGATDLRALRQRIAERMTERGVTPEQQAVKMAEFQGMTAGQRALGTRTANIEMAANEARNMMPIALQAAADVPRTHWTPINKLIERWQTGVESDPAQAKFAAANFSLVNSYVRAIAPTGVPPESAREHALQMLSGAMSHESYKAVVATMDQEMQAALHSPGQVMEKFRELYGSTPGAAAPAHAAAPAAHAAPSAAPVRVNTPAEAQALAPGTRYVTPDGRVYTR